MYPQLINQASRLAPMLSRILQRGGTFATPLWKAGQVEAPGVTAQPVSPVEKPTGPSVPISLSNYEPPRTYPQGEDPMSAGGSASNGPGLPSYSANGPSPLDNAQWPFGPIGAPTRSASPAVPTPSPRPAEAPQSEPDMSFWQRNAAMMRDPSSGDFIDPTTAAKAVRGPDLINKMMSYLHNKDIG